MQSLLFQLSEKGLTCPPVTKELQLLGSHHITSHLCPQQRQNQSQVSTFFPKEPDSKYFTVFRLYPLVPTTLPLITTYSFTSYLP